MDYPSLAFRMIILFGMNIALQSGITVNPYPTAPLKCVVIPQFADEDARAERLTPECARAHKRLLQHSPFLLPLSAILDDPEITGKPAGPRSFRGAGIWRRCSEMGSGAREGGAQSVLSTS